MADSYDVIVVGAGLGGSSAAVHLVSRGHSVLLLEKHFYPVHKLCGEFLSGESESYIRRLGALDTLNDSRPQRVYDALITTRGGKRFAMRLRNPGYGISRFALDHMLMVRAVAAGVTVRQGASVKRIEGDLDRGFTIATDTSEFRGRLVVGAFGKRSQLDRKLGRHYPTASRSYVAFKAHFQGAPDTHTVELHAFAGGYCGFCPLGDGIMNACWIGSEELLRDAGGDPEVMLMRVAADNPLVADRLDGLQRIPSTYLATSQLYFRPRGAFAADVCMVGDSAGLIAPMCGDGMSMALRSSEVLVPLADRFLRGRVDREMFKRRYARRWTTEFGARMQLGYWLHEGFCTPGAAEPGVSIVRFLPGLGRLLLRATRG